MCATFPAHLIYNIYLARQSIELTLNDCGKLWCFEEDREEDMYSPYCMTNEKENWVTLESEEYHLRNWVSVQTVCLLICCLET
jgi:hypothetical protein